MSRKKLASLILAAICLLSSCAPAIEPEPAISASVTEATTRPETEAETDVETDAAETTEEITSPPETDEVTSPPETEPPAPLSAGEILLLSESLAASYDSYARRTLTSLSLNVLGTESSSRTDSELRVSGTGAFFRRTSEDGVETLYLSDGELYRETELGKIRVGGWSRESFLSLVSDSSLHSAFTGGTVTEEGEDLLLSFDELSENGKSALVAMLGLPEGYAVKIEKASLELRTDAEANLISSVVRIRLTVSAGGSVLMTVDLRTDTEQSAIGAAIDLELPAREDHVYFKNDEVLRKYTSVLGDVGSFTDSRDKFEYSVSDSILISSESSKLSLSSNTVYAYSKRIGASIEKAFDIGDGTGKHTTLTHFNNRRGFSQIDGGSIFVDTTVNAGNLAFTLAYPFTTSFYSIDRCLGTVDELTSDRLIALSLDESAARGIADGILLRIGASASSASIEEYEAYTYIKLSAKGEVEAIGYVYSAKALLDGKTYTLERSVELEIVSRDSANVKVIYIEVEDDDE